MTIQRRRYDLVAFGVVFLALSTYFGYGYATSYARQMRAARRYRAVPATVVSSEIVERGSAATTRGPSYVPRIVTRYEVSGQPFQSDRYSYAGAGWSDRAAVQAVLDRYQTGSAVEVYVDPFDPRLAVLDPTPPDGQAAWVLALFVVFPIGLVLYGLGVWGRR